MKPDILIVGAGLCGVLLAEKLAEESEASIFLMEAGKSYPFEERAERRQDFIDYQYNPFPGVHDLGPYSAVGGLALHWGGHAARFTEQDFRSWPISYDELEPYLCEAEERAGVSGDEGGLSYRSKPYPMPALPLSYGVKRVQEWVTRAGLKTRTQPYARNSVEYAGRPACTACDTCYVCPTGAKYSPDFTLNSLVESGRVKLLKQHQVLRLEAGPDQTIHRVLYRHVDSGERGELEAGQVVLAGGTVWTSALLLASGLANSSGLVGKWIAAHSRINARYELPEPLYPGQYGRIGIQCDQFTGDQELRFELRFRALTPAPQIRDESGKLLLGDGLMNRWKDQLSRGLAGMMVYFEVPPVEESRVIATGELNGKLKFKWSPQLPGLKQRMEQKVAELSEKLEAAGGRFLDLEHDTWSHHPAGGCRMGTDPKSSVCNPWGQTHDHTNLWVAGAPLFLTGGITSSSLTFVALSLRTGTRILETLQG